MIDTLKLIAMCACLVGVLSLGAVALVVPYLPNHEIGEASPMAPVDMVAVGAVIVGLLSAVVFALALLGLGATAVLL